MAIDRTGKVTTTGLMGETSKVPKAPDMSNLTPPAPAQAPAPMAEGPAPERTQDSDIEKRLQDLNEIEAEQLKGLLGPSNAAIFKKIAPEASGIIDQFTSEEDVVSLPISIVTAYAVKMYGGDEKLAVQNFITDLSGEQSDNTNVPPDTATQTQGMMAQDPNAEQDITPEMEAIDSGQELA